MIKILTNIAKGLFLTLIIIILLMILAAMFLTMFGYI